jgi:hypothetical protein
MDLIEKLSQETGLKVEKLDGGTYCVCEESGSKVYANRLGMSLYLFRIKYGRRHGPDFDRQVTAEAFRILGHREKNLEGVNLKKLEIYRKAESGEWVPVEKPDFPRPPVEG